MPYGATPYTPLPYAKPAYEDTSVGRLSDLIRLRGQIASDQAQAYGAASAQKWNAIGRAGGQALSDLAAIPEQNRLRKRQEAEDAMRRQAFQSEQSVRAVQLAEAQGRLGQQQQWNQTVATNPADPEGFQGPHQPGDEPGAMNWDAIIPKLNGDNLVKAKEAQAHDYEQAAKIDQINNLSIARAAADATNLPEYLKRLELLGSTPQLQWAAERERQAASGLDPSQWEMFQFSKTKGTPFESKPVEMNKDTSLIDPRTTRVLAEGPKSVPTKPQPNEMSAYLDAAGGDAKKALADRNADELRKAAAGKSASGARPITQTAESQLVARLNKQWTDATKPARELDRQVSMMDAGLDAARRGDLAQGAQAVLVTFQKVLDPPSVVRESEYMRSSAGLSLMNRVRGAAERIMKGGAGVPLPELEKFAQLAKEAAKAQQSAYVPAVKSRLSQTADRYNIPHELVFDYEPASDAPPGAGPITLDVGGKTYTFPNAAALDGFKKAAGIK